MVRELGGLAAATLTAALAGLPAPALAGSPASVPLPRAGRPPEPPMVLPGAPAATATLAGRSASGWLVGARPGRAARRIAARHGAESLLDGGGVYAVSRAGAFSLARDLRAAGLLTFAEPDRVEGRHTMAAKQPFPTDPLTARQWWVRSVVDRRLRPPPVTDDSPVVAVLDSQLDRSHPEIRNGNITSHSRQPLDRSEYGEAIHGTAVATTAGAPADGHGIVGIWPGMRVIVFPHDLSRPSTIVRAINQAVRAGVTAINMSYGGPDEDFAEQVALNFALGRGVVLVAAAGNEFNEGNPVEYPAGDPHVLTVAGLTSNDRSYGASNENDGVDLSAPATDVLTAVPRAFDDSGPKDGYAVVGGTSFASPIVAAVVAWVKARRPELTQTQLADLVRRSSRDLGPTGWEPRFGYGAVNVRRALNRPAPPHDPNEPNDDIRWVNGSSFVADEPIWRPGSGVTRLRASVDQWEDPADVYRVIVPAHGGVRAYLKPEYGDADLAAYAVGSRSVYGDQGLLDLSHRNGTAPDQVVVSNPTSRARIAYLDVYIDPAIDELNSRYRLVVRRR